jgi:hypothetical protein
MLVIIEAVTSIFGVFGLSVVIGIAIVSLLQGRQR